MNKPKLNQPDVETSTTLSAKELQELIDEYCITPQNIREILIVGQMFRKSNLTIEEVEKEWDEDGWHWHHFYTENGIINSIRITKYIPSRKRDGSGDCQLEIYLYPNTKTFSINFDMDMKEYIRLTKTFRALRWFDE